MSEPASRAEAEKVLRSLFEADRAISIAVANRESLSAARIEEARARRHRLWEDVVDRMVGGAKPTGETATSTPRPSLAGPEVAGHGAEREQPRLQFQVPVWSGCPPQRAEGL